MASLVEYLPKRMIKPLEKKKIYTVNDYVTFIPRKYYDFSKIYTITAAPREIPCAVKGCLLKIDLRGDFKKFMSLSFKDEDANIKYHCTWFGNNYAFKWLSALEGEEVIITGTVNYDEKYGYSIINPMDMCISSSFFKRIQPVYSKIKGISEEAFKKELKGLLKTVKDPLSIDIIDKMDEMEYTEALRELHYPKSMERVEKARNRLEFNDLLYFVASINKDAVSKETSILFPHYENTIKFVKSLPFPLTADQNKILNRVVKTQDRLNLLVQGDVGCGKTIVAAGAMMLAAENGYQAVLMAPTKVLAKQHYDEICKYAEQTGYTCVYLDSKMKVKEKREMLAKIVTGEANFIIGTQSCLSDSVMYNNLGISIVDEEHKFGVKQKEKLRHISENGIHCISMTATPIPRTFASALYGDDKEIMNIVTMPNGRKPIQTAINNSDMKIFEFMKKQISQGHQCYVVCPAIEENEDMTSVKEVEKKYKNYFEPLGMKVGIVTGKMAKEDVDATINMFSENVLSVLISTTVIEVGVNVPNATVMTIEQADQFGLASLHQLRGRVGRSDLQSYCILRSDNKENERLQTMVSTTSGFEIAEADLKIRGAGELLGTRQSGYDKFLNLMFLKPDMYNFIKDNMDYLRQHNLDNLMELYVEHDEMEAAKH